MLVDKQVALRILEEEVEAAKSDAAPEAWIALIKKLEIACGGDNLTFFAALGTAMLAKATNPAIDVHALKSSVSERGYSARTVCQHVLAAYAPKYGIDLGVTGREPLNNSPFYRESLISENLVVNPR